MSAATTQSPPDSHQSLGLAEATNGILSEQFRACLSDVKERYPECELDVSRIVSNVSSSSSSDGDPGADDPPGLISDCDGNGDSDPQSINLLTTKKVKGIASPANWNTKNHTSPREVTEAMPGLGMVSIDHEAATALWKNAKRSISQQSRLKKDGPW